MKTNQPRRQTRIGGYIPGRDGECNCYLCRTGHFEGERFPERPAVAADGDRNNNSATPASA